IFQMVGSLSSHSLVMYIIVYFVTGILTQYLPPSLFQNPALSGGVSQPMGGMMMPSPMQIPGFPQQRMPVMVMPFHSKVADKKYMRRKKRKPKRVYADSESTSGSDSDCSSSSNEHLRTQKHRSGHRKKKRQVLTPVISYVTRNGRVVYQKKIKKENAGDWLEIGNRKIPSRLVEEEEKKSGEMTIREMKNKYGIRHNHHSHDD
ncbi:uncharacterized protein LOC120627148, partial [Pararge aegeria]|uniref:uncharacterized protein LOC120627148 n=1 Tax=Pararge aegeria TaxID=116150 RepID=UPI0019CF931A